MFKPIFYVMTPCYVAERGFRYSMMCKHVFTPPCIFNQLVIDLRLQMEITLETLEANPIERSRKFLHNPRLRYTTVLEQSRDQSRDIF